MSGQPPASDSDSLQQTVLTDDTLLRRLAPSGAVLTTIFRPHIEKETATSFAIRPRPGEDFPSWSLERITSPTELLAIEGRRRQDMTGWKVVRVSVRDVRELGLDVRADPLPGEDLGHCLIVPSASGKFSSKIWSKLALLTRVVEV